MSPAAIIHYKTSKRKIKSSNALLTTANARKRRTDTLNRDAVPVSSPRDLKDVDDEVAQDVASNPSRIPGLLMSSRKQGFSFYAVRRQDTEPQGLSSDALSPSAPGSSSLPTSSLLLSATSPASATVPTAASFTETSSSASTPKSEGQSPISSLAVQLVLGGLAAICFAAVFFRCLHVSRQHQSIVEARRRNLASARAQAAIHASALRGGGPLGVSGNGTTGTRLVPTNEMTLAGRLNMYQARSGANVQHYPYGQEPIGAAAGGRDGVLLDSIYSFVAPSYEQDVSPPPFMPSSGKPPAYTEVVTTPNPPSYPPREP